MLPEPTNSPVPMAPPSARNLAVRQHLPCAADGVRCGNVLNVSALQPAVELVLARELKLLAHLVCCPRRRAGRALGRALFVMRHLSMVPFSQCLGG